MAVSVDWEKIEKPRTSGVNKFLRLEANRDYLIRLIKKPVMFFKYTIKRNGKIYTAITENPDTCEVRKNHPEINKASARLAVLVLHRDGGNQLKILEGPVSMFETFRMYKNLTEVDPGSRESINFKIKVICPSGKKDQNTIYQVDPIKEDKPSILTAEEINYVKENAKDFELEKIFAHQTPEAIEKRLFQDDNDSSHTVPAAHVPAPVPAPAPVHSASAKPVAHVKTAPPANTDVGDGLNDDF